MDREDIIRMAREACDQAPREDWNSTAWVFGDETLERFATLVAATERNKLAAWMMSQGYATGHGDSIEKLLEELEWQIEERIRNEREACAAVCDDIRRMGGYSAETPDWERGTGRCADAIRARGNK